VKKESLNSNKFKLINLKDKIKQKVIREAEEAVIMEDLEMRKSDRMDLNKGDLSEDPFKRVYR
jgi:hypothetical protein